MIPKILHIIWVGDEQRQPRQLIDTWVKHHPEWNVRLWGNEDLVGREWNARLTSAIGLSATARLWPTSCAGRSCMSTEASVWRPTVFACGLWTRPCWISTLLPAG